MKLPVQNVAIVGASNKPDRYAFKAFQMLREYGHSPLPVHPKLQEVLGVRCYPTLKDITAAGVTIDTVTLYVGAPISSKLAQDIRGVRPRRVIFNPGAENPELEEELSKSGIESIEGCTLVMLRSGQF